MRNTVGKRLGSHFFFYNVTNMCMLYSRSLIGYPRNPGF